MTSHEVILVLDTGLRLKVRLFNPRPDGECYFHCLIAAFSQHSTSFVIDPQIPRDSGGLRRYVCEHLKKYTEVDIPGLGVSPIPGLGVSPLEYFRIEYSESARVRQRLHNSDYNASLVQRGEDPHMKPLFCDTFENYLEWMKHPRTQVDGLIVAFSAFVLKIDLTVYTRSISDIHLETSDVQEVSCLISMGFSKCAAERVLLETSGDMDAAIDRLLQRDTTHSATSEAKQDGKDVWREQPYHYPSSVFKISLIQDGYHFQLIVHEVQESVQPEELSSFPIFSLMPLGFPRQKAEQALVKANGDVEAAVEILLSERRVTVMLPDVSEELLSSPESALSCVANREQLYRIINCELQMHFSELPRNLVVEVRIQRCADAHFLKSLIDGFIFPELDNVKYRIVCFTFEDESNIVWSKKVEDLSHSAEKMQFFCQVWEKIAIQSVTRVVLERC